MKNVPLIRDAADPRDQIFVGVSHLPAVDLRQYVSKVENQEWLNSCYSHSSVMAVEMLLRQFRPKDFTELSELYVWYNARARTGNEKNNVGLMTRTIMKALEKDGCCPASLWPFDTSKFAVQPPKAAYKSGRKLRIKRYLRCISSDNVKSALTAGFPVVFAMHLRHGFGETPFDVAYSIRPFTGWHAMVAVGYTDKHVIVLNSWGKDWSGDGYIEIPWNVFEADVSDKWAITGIKTWLDRAWKAVKNFFN